MTRAHFAGEDRGANQLQPTCHYGRPARRHASNPGSRPSSGRGWIPRPTRDRVRQGVSATTHTESVRSCLLQPGSERDRPLGDGPGHVGQRTCETPHG
jgi:hypothetical protein